MCYHLLEDKAVYTWKVEVALLQKSVFALPLTLHNRCTGLFRKPRLNSRNNQSGFSEPAIHPSHGAESNIPFQERLPTHACQSFLRGRLTWSDEVPTLASFGCSHLEEPLLWAPSNVLTGSARPHKTLASMSLICLPGYCFNPSANFTPTSLSQCCLRTIPAKEKQGDI